MQPKPKILNEIYKANLTQTLYEVGLFLLSRTPDSLQGNIWRALHIESRQQVAVKVGDKEFDDILTESRVLEYLSSDPMCSDFIIKHYAFFNCDRHDHLIMEYGGTCFFDFIVKVHQFIHYRNVAKYEWYRTVRYLFNQMLDAVEYLHSKNVCHFDISLENFCINELDIELYDDGRFTFCIEKKDHVRLKLVDFEFAKLFEPGSDFMISRTCGKKSYFSPEICNNVKYNAKKNDVWCLGICLFMMIFGGAPWEMATLENVNFMQTMVRNGDITFLLSTWDDIYPCDEMLVDLFKHFFQFEGKRADLKTIKNHSWLQQTQ